MSLPFLTAGHLSPSCANISDGTPSKVFGLDKLLKKWTVCVCLLDSVSVSETQRERETERGEVLS